MMKVVNEVYSTQTLVTRPLVLLLCNTSLVQRAQCAGPCSVTYGVFSIFPHSVALDSIWFVHHRHLGH